LIVFLLWKILDTRFETEDLVSGTSESLVLKTVSLTAEKNIVLMTDDIVTKYDQLVARCPRFERKGKNNPYTSANGHMFSQINKAGQLGIRFSKEVQGKYIQELGTDYFKSYGATMRGYVLMPEHLWDDLDTLVKYLNEAYDYVMSLEPK
jgi:hypothetical protein